MYYSGKGSGIGSLTSSQSVSFRQGSNVEFGGVSAPTTPGTGTEAAYSLEETGVLPQVGAGRGGKGRDFSNPMYEAVTRTGVVSHEPIREYNCTTLNWQ